jgi:asparagine synthase (glutamine-hydrolysing)
VRVKHRRAPLREPWFTPELARHLRSEPERLSDWTLDQNLKRAVDVGPLPLFLRVEDRNSMAHSLEARLPFLDYRLVSLAFSLPPDWKMRGRWNKYVLRQAMRQRIPESVRTRVDKMGFPVPQKAWFADALYAGVQDLIASPEVRQRGIYNLSRVQQDLALHRQGRVDASGKLFRLVQIETWLKLASREGEPVAVPSAVNQPSPAHRVTLTRNPSRGTAALKSAERRTDLHCAN